MGLLKGALKLVGSAALVVTGTASAIVRQVANATDNPELENLVGRAQDASFNKIKDMWTSDDEKDDKYYENQQEKSLDREYNSKMNAARQCRNMAEAAQKAGNDEKYNTYMDKYYALKEEADMIRQSGKDC